VEPVNNLPLSIAWLLQYRNGTCNHWAYFFHAILFEQGISSGQIIAVVPMNDGVNNQDDLHSPFPFGLLVNDVAFNGQGTASEYGGFKWVEYEDFTYEGSRKAQGGTPIVQAFNEHLIYMYNGTFYDTSYGIVATTPRQYEKDALAGTYYSAPNGIHYGRKNNVNSPGRITIFIQHFPLY
jgi:hypothetical protein